MSTPALEWCAWCGQDTETWRREGTTHDVCQVCGNTKRVAGVQLLLDPGMPPDRIELRNADGTPVATITGLAKRTALAAFDDAVSLLDEYRADGLPESVAREKAFKRTLWPIIFNVTGGDDD